MVSKRDDTRSLDISRVDLLIQGNIVEVSDAEIQRQIEEHRSNTKQIIFQDDEESYLTSNNDLGATAVDAIDRANSIADAKQNKLNAARPESHQIRLKSTEVHSRFSKNIDKTTSGKQAAYGEVFSMTNS